VKTLAQRNKQRGKILRWLRKVHGWLGLWGALLGLLFGISGFLLNHRAVLKIPALEMEVSEVELLVPNPFPKDRKAFSTFIQSALAIRQTPENPKNIENKKNSNIANAGVIREARFMNKNIRQPDILELTFNLPQSRIQAEYVVGNQYAKVKREDVNALGFIMRMHKGVGANAAWVLLADSIAGAIILLSMTGILLWTKMRGSRLILSGLIGTSAILMVAITLTML
jgi:uncharacterized protein